MNYLLCFINSADSKNYWKIVAFDNQGAQSIGPIWMFTTKKSKSKTSNEIEVNPITVNQTVIVSNKNNLLGSMI